MKSPSIGAMPHADGQWWIAKYPAAYTCHRCNAVTHDPPAIQRYVPDLDHAGSYGRRFADWVEKGWRVWRACSHCGHECSGGGCRTITATDAQIDLWTRRIGPWLPLHQARAQTPQSVPAVTAPPGWSLSSSGGSIYRTIDGVHVSAFPKRARGGQWYVKVEMPVDVEDEREAAAIAEKVARWMAATA